MSQETVDCQGGVFEAQTGVFWPVALRQKVILISSVKMYLMYSINLFFSSKERIRKKKSYFQLSPGKRQDLWRKKNKINCIHCRGQISLLLILKAFFTVSRTSIFELTTFNYVHVNAPFGAFLASSLKQSCSCVCTQMQTLKQLNFDQSSKWPVSFMESSEWGGSCPLFLSFSFWKIFFSNWNATRK